MANDIPHGTWKGYQLEMRRKYATICPACREAGRAHRAEVGADPVRREEMRRQARARSTALRQVAALYPDDFGIFYRRAYRAEAARA